MPVALHGGVVGFGGTVRDLDLPNALRDEFRVVYMGHGGPAVRDIPGHTGPAIHQKPEG